MKSLLEILRPKFRHPLQPKAPLPGRTPQDVAKREHKHALLAAHIAAYREEHIDFDEPTRRRLLAMREAIAELKETAPHYHAGSEDPCAKVENFISTIYDVVDAALYRGGL